MAQSSSATGGDNTSVQAARARARTQRGPVSDRFWSSPPLLLGAGGMLHQAWQELLNRWEIPHLSWGQGDMDLTSPESIEKAIAAVRFGAAPR